MVWHLKSYTVKKNKNLQQYFGFFSLWVFIFQSRIFAVSHKYMNVFSSRAATEVFNPKNITIHFRRNNFL